MRHTFKTELELEVTVLAHVAPATPPRPSMDPDSPAYSDPGDPGERSIEAVYMVTPAGRYVDITDCLTPDEITQLADEAYEDAMNALDDTP
jgi:hypothetical protein